MLSWAALCSAREMNEIAIGDARQDVYLCLHLEGPWTGTHGRQPCDGMRLD